MNAYSYSIDEEAFTGSFSTPEDAAREAFAEFPDAEIVTIGENVLYTAHDFIDERRLLDDVAYRADDEAGEFSEDWLYSDWLYSVMKSSQKCAELKKIIGDWIETHAPVTFFTVRNVRAIKRHELEEKK